MASPADKRKKGILKPSGSVEHNKKEIEWDEMNIIATYHPANKDYGFMKVEEPPTPFNRAAVSDNEDEVSSEREGSEGLLDPEQLARRLEANAGSSVDRKYYQDDDEEDNSAESENMTEEERKRRKEFLLKRKMHYNEFAAVQLAKKLLAEDEDEEDVNSASSSHSKSSSNVESKGPAKAKKSTSKKAT